MRSSMLFLAGALCLAGGSALGSSGQCAGTSRIGAGYPNRNAAGSGRYRRNRQEGELAFAILLPTTFAFGKTAQEQTIKSFSFEAELGSQPNAPPRYLILFFDNSTMNPGDQARARQAAAKFIESNAGPKRLIAIINYGGAIRIAQNFTADTERLKQAVSGVKTSAVSPNAPNTPVQLLPCHAAYRRRRDADFGVRSVLLALRSMAKNLASVPGRKTMVLFSSGFPLTPEYRSELTAAINACNRANVAIYPVDVRGLVAGTEALPPQTYLRHGHRFGPVASHSQTADVPRRRYGLDLHKRVRQRVQRSGSAAVLAAGRVRCGQYRRRFPGREGGGIPGGGKVAAGFPGREGRFWEHGRRHGLAG